MPVPFHPVRYAASRPWAKRVAHLFEHGGKTAVADCDALLRRTLQAAQASLLAARTLHDAQKVDDARAALQWVVDKGNDDAYQAIARVRLAGLLMDKQAFDDALKVLDAKVSFDSRHWNGARTGTPEFRRESRNRE